MKKAEVTVKGTSPLLMHKYPLVPIEALEKKSVEEQAELAAYRTPEGKLYVPGINIQRALIAGATYSKGKGRGSLQRVAAACLLVSPEYVILDAQMYEIDTRSVVIPSTKGRVLRYRPRMNEWQITFELEWDETLMTEAQVRRIVDDTGLRVGLLDFRPEKKGPFGKFVVVNWKV